MTAAALDNIIVIDLSRILAGPWASQILADLGAEVIKIERPQSGDDTRSWGPPFIKHETENNKAEASYYHATNRNKKSIAIDITKKEGQEIIRDLVKKADVFIENFKVGGLKKYGLDYKKLSKINPKLIYCSISGFGQTGPCKNRPGYDAMIQGEGGLMSLTGNAEAEPMKVGVAVVDIMTGLYSSNAILAALFARSSTGEGQYIDISLFDVQTATLANQGMNYLTTDKVPERQGNGHPNIVPYQTFETKDGHLILAIGNDNQYKTFCDCADLKSLSVNPKFLTNKDRVLNRNVLVPLIAEKIRQYNTDYWVELLDKHSVPAGPVNDLKKVFSHPQLIHRQMVRYLPDSNQDSIKTISSPMRLSKTPIQYKHAAPELGEHSTKILMDYLGFDEVQIQQLKNRDILD